MSGKWYESRTNQAALIGGVALVIGAAIGALPSILRSRASPQATFEIKTLGQGGEHTLATLAMEPAGQVLDSSAFSRLSESFIVNDSLGIAFSRPDGQDWTVGP